MARRRTNRTIAEAAAGVIRVALYLRRSTDEENQPFTIEAQNSKLRAYVASQPSWQIVEVYQDDASGAKLDRKDLRRALKDARAGRFDILLVYRVDRFTRRIRDLVTLLDELDEVGVAFRSATEPFDTSTPAGRMLVQMLGVFAEFEREMIIDRVINGMERKAAKGQWTLGVTPYGYRVDPQTQTLQRDPDEAATIDEIFRLYTQQRMGTRAIAGHLNQLGRRRRSGRPWSHKTVGDALTNRAYLGEVHFRDIIADQAHPAIITTDVFDLADRILTERGENPAKKATAASDYHLTGKITCPRCGRKYLGTVATGKNRSYRYYTCFTRSRYGTSQCAAPRIDADRLDNTVLDALRDFYTNRLDLITEAIEDTRTRYLASIAGLQSELDTVTAQLAAKETVVDRYLSDYENEKIDRDTVARRVDKLSEEIRQLRHRRDELHFRIDAEPETPDPQTLAGIANNIVTIINEGSTIERKSLCDATLIELRLNSDNTATPVFRIPTTDTTFATPTNPPSQRKPRSEGVRERPPSVDLVREYSKRLDLLDDLGRVAQRIKTGWSSILIHSVRSTGRAANPWPVTERLTDAEARSIVTAFRAGTPKHELATRHNLSFSSVKRLLRRHRGGFAQP